MFDTFGRKETSWAGKTYEEILEIGNSRGSIVVVPVGSIEQHGHHLPVSTDTVLCDAVAHGGARDVFDELPVLVTPPVWSGLSSHHMPFGGTLTTEFTTLLDLLADIGDAAIDNGFDSILLLNGHGGNMALISTALNRIGADHTDVEVLGLTYFYLASSFVQEIRDSEMGGMMHGGEMETSLMLHLRPDLVREDRAESTVKERKYDLLLDDLFGSGPLGMYSTFADHSESGVMGDPTVASEEKGERIYTHLVEELGTLLADIHEALLEE